MGLSQFNRRPAMLWIVQGKNEFSISPEDAGIIADAIRRAAADDGLVGKTAELNSQIACEQLDGNVIRPQVMAMYERIAGQAREARPRKGG